MCDVLLKITQRIKRDRRNLENASARSVNWFMLSIHTLRQR